MLTETNATILIVDDTPQNIQVLATFLSAQGYSVVAATNGAEALRSVENSPPDLILLDVMMPVMDGYETCMKLKSNPDTSEIPVIFLTAKSEVEDLVKGFELGAVDYVSKPFNSVELLARVATQIELKQSRDRLVQLGRERKEFIQILCHDLTNPLGFISGVMDMARDEPTIITTMQSNIESSVRNSLELIELVRTMLALDDGKLKLRTAPYDLAKLIEESRTILTNQLNAKDVRLELDLECDLMVKVEKTSFINSVLNNLLTNAIKFSPRNSTIKLQTSCDDSMVALKIQDCGIGMSPDLLGRIFDLNHAVSRAGTEGEPGTGFGMPLVKKFVEGYGGKIEITSREQEKYPEDHGTTITLYLPGS